MTREDLEDALVIANTAKSVPSRLVTQVLSERRDLLAACKTALSVCELYANGTPLIQEAAEHLKAAIAKANGEHS